MNLSRAFNTQILCASNKHFEITLAKKILRDYAKANNCVFAIQETEFISTKDGLERGLSITLVNNPNLETDEESIVQETILIADLLMEKLKQEKIIVLTPKETIQLFQNDETCHTMIID